MSLTQHRIEPRDGYVYFAVAKGQPVADIVNAAKTTVALCQQLNFLKTVVDIADFDSQPPTLGQSFRLVTEIATFIDRRLRIALVDPHGWLAKDNFPWVVAQNRGLHFAVFRNQPDALQWLLPDPLGTA